MTRQAKTKSSHAGPMVMMNGRMVSLVEVERPSKNMKTITEATQSTTTHVATMTRRARIGP